MISTIQEYVDGLSKEFDDIPKERKDKLNAIADYISKKRFDHQPVQLVYICTHNSRRSHFGQVWAHVAAKYYGIESVQSYSGGIEVTTFNMNAIRTLERIGFVVKASNESENPLYHLTYDQNESPIVCFSKVYDDKSNPQKHFAAIMVCGDADENCPFVPESDFRISTTYRDPKEYDHTALQDEKYDERCRQIAVEIFYTFSLVK